MATGATRTTTTTAAATTTVAMTPNGDEDNENDNSKGVNRGCIDKKLENIFLQNYNLKYGNCGYEHVE